MHELHIIFEALALAAERHRDQRRKDSNATPYINHPIALAQLLTATGGIKDGVVLCAAILHDTIEDTKTTEAELRERFGDEVAGIVAEVTDDKSLPKARRKELQVEHAAEASRGAALVKLADKTCNLRDMAATPPGDWPLARRQEYFDWARRVVEALPPVSEPLLRAFEDAYAARPGGPPKWSGDQGQEAKLFREDGSLIGTHYCGPSGRRGAVIALALSDGPKKQRTSFKLEGRDFYESYSLVVEAAAKFYGVEDRGLLLRLSRSAEPFLARNKLATRVVTHLEVVEAPGATGNPQGTSAR